MLKRMILGLLILGGGEGSWAQMNWTAISPKVVRGLLQAPDVVGLGPVTKILGAGTTDTLRAALQLGLQFQGAGNESMIYDVPALVNIAKGSREDSSDFHRQLWGLTVEVLAEGAANPAAYAELAQVRGSLRLCARLQLEGQEESAQKLLNYLKANFDFEKKEGTWGLSVKVLADLRRGISNTGQATSPTEKAKLLDQIGQLPSGVLPSEKD